MTVHIKDQFFTKNPILLSRIYFTDNKLLCISAFNSRTLNISWKQQIKGNTIMVFAGIFLWG